MAELRIAFSQFSRNFTISLHTQVYRSGHNELDLKSCLRSNSRGFESLRLRHSLGILSEFQGFFFAFMRLKCCLLLRRLPVCSYDRRGYKYLPSYSYPSVQASLESSSSVLCWQGAKMRRNVANRGIEFVSIRFWQE